MDVLVSDKSFYIQIIAFRRAMALLNRNRQIIITGIAVAIALGMTIFMLTVIPSESYLPDRDAAFVYGFAYPELAEQVDKSKEFKAWIGYEESVPASPYLSRWDPQVALQILPNHIVTHDRILVDPESKIRYPEVEQYVSKYPILARIIAEQKSEWISNDLARSIRNDFYGSYYNVGTNAGCGQYKYVEIVVLGFPITESDMTFVPIVSSNPDFDCINYNPHIPG